MGSLIKDIFSQGSLIQILVVVVLAGALASLTSCTIARLPVMLGLVSTKKGTRQHELHLALAFSCGLIFTYTIFGILFGIFAHFASKLVGISYYLYTFLGVMLIFAGSFLAGLIPLHLTWVNKTAQRVVEGGRSIPSAFVFGVVFAFLEMPACASCGSVMLLIASFVALKNSLIYSGIIFFAFALGQSLPILALGFSSNLLKKIVPITSKLEGYVSFIIGNILILTGVFLLIIA